MSDTHSQPLVLQALEALKLHNRRQAAALLRQDLATAPPGGKRWLDVARLAGIIGERGIELDAMRRFSETRPQTLDHILAYGQTLSRFGRSADSVILIDTLPDEARDHPATQHFRGMVASETGDFATAELHFRKALAGVPTLARAWQGLATAKTFRADDPDLALMENMRLVFAAQPPESRATFLYALGKAWHDAGDFSRAANVYGEGAALMREVDRYDSAAWHGAVRERLAEPWADSGLKPSSSTDSRVMFVTGLPRSGTTLVEQILSAHPDVAGGGEMNVIGCALLPAGNGSLAGARAYEARSASVDPWGETAQDYLGMIAERWGREGRVVDKSLLLSNAMGLILHALPGARIVWLRRNPEDCALSIFRTLFLPGAMRWSWSLADIADFMKGEDALHAYWAERFPDRILTVPYEALVGDSETWIRRILTHVGLYEVPQVFAPHLQQRSVMTASVAQVRAPIHTGRVGAAASYGGVMDAFRRTYSS